MRKVGKEMVWFGERDKRREGVTRLIKLFYQSKLQNLQVQNFIFQIKYFSNNLNFAHKNIFIYTINKM
jgi:hypothetical protein